MPAKRDQNEVKEVKESHKNPTQTEEGIVVRSSEVAAARIAEAVAKGVAEGLKPK